MSQPTGLTAQGLVFRAKANPVASTTSGGVFQLTLLTFAEVSGRQREAWRLYWAGAEAQAWWAEHGAELLAGDPLHVQVERIRTHVPARDAAPEIHAQVRELQLRPRRWDAPQSPATSPAAHAQA